VTKYAFAACVFLAHSGYSRKYAFSTVDVLDGGFTEEKEDVLADVVGAHKIGFYKIKTIF